MASALDQDREARPAYVRFETVAIEDRAATLAAGHYVAKDVDYALITPPYSKDVMKHKVSIWLPQLDLNLKNNRIPAKWVADYKAAYKAFQEGKELPVNGTPIRGWALISPAQIETLIKMQILTVEDLANANDEGIKRIGMGGLDLKNKASAYLKEKNNSGQLTLEMANLQQEHDVLQGVNSNLQEKNDALERRISALESGSSVTAVDEPSKVDVDDILESPPAVKVKRPKK